MGPLFGMLREADTLLLTVSPPLVSAIVELVWDALFHEEHLEGYREAFTAAEAATAAAAVGETAVPATADTIERGAKKRRRKSNKGGSDAADAHRSGDGGGAGGGDSGRGGATIPRRACYQQQLLEELGRLAVVGAETEQDAKMTTHLGALRGAPLLLEGFIVRLIGQAQNNKHADIHQAVSGGIATSASGGGGPVSSMGGKRPRSSVGISTHAARGGSGGGSNVSSAALMFKMWIALTGALSPLCFDRKETAMDVESRTATLAKSQHVANVDAQMPGREQSSASGLVVPFLRSSNAMLQLLVKHDVYRVNEDWGDREFKQLEAFAAMLFDLAGSTKPAADRVTVRHGHYCDIVVAAGAPQEFMKAFHALLGMNHNILHKNLRPLFRMAFEWAAVDPAAVTAANEPVVVAANLAEAETARPLEPLRPLAVALVVSLVDTYGRLRQMDHLVQALFGAISDSPSASASMLRGDVCKSALGR